MLEVLERRGRPHPGSAFVFRVRCCGCGTTYVLNAPSEKGLTERSCVSCAAKARGGRKMIVAALYVDPRGPYPKLGVDCWDESRDAREYDGPYPVVAHPPCGPWGRLRHLYCGNEHDCAPRAVEQVRKFGGVLEHPAQSLLWNAPEQTYVEDGAIGVFVGLPLPSDGVDPWGGYAIEVDQVEWGHVARKRTWLYLVGVPREALEAPPFPGREPTHCMSGSRGRNAGNRKRGLLKETSAEQRRRTPPLFAEYLVRLARAVGEARKAVA